MPQQILLQRSLTVCLLLLLAGCPATRTPVELRVGLLRAPPGNEFLDVLWRASGGHGVISPHARGPLAAHGRVVPAAFPTTLQVLSDSLGTSWHQLVEPDTLTLGRYRLSASLYLVADGDATGYMVSVHGTAAPPTSFLLEPGRQLFVCEPAPLGLLGEGLYIVPEGPLLAE